MLRGLGISLHFLPVFRRGAPPIRARALVVASRMFHSPERDRRRFMSAGALCWRETPAERKKTRVANSDLHVTRIMIRIELRW